MSDINTDLNANLKKGEVVIYLKKSNADVELKNGDSDVDLKKCDSKVELKRVDVDLRISYYSLQWIVKVKHVLLKYWFELVNLYDNSGN